MIYKHSKLFIIAMLAMVLTLITPTVASAADVWLITTLRNDSVVDTQRRYGVNIWAGFIPDYWGTPYNQGHYAEGRLRLRYPDEAGQIDAVNFGLITYDPYWAGETGIG